MSLDTAKTLPEWMAAFRAAHWRAGQTPAEAMRRIRALLAGGWSEPYSTDANGRDCNGSSEAVVKLCLDDAMRLVAGDADAAVVLELEVQRQLRATGSADSLSTWLQARWRTLAEVQQLLANTERRLALEEKRHV